VFEHVPDYIGFLEKCKPLAKYKIYHIPLDIHVSSVLRGSFVNARYSVGHLHYFSEESALATLKDTGHEIVDCFYTNGAFGFPYSVSDFQLGYLVVIPCLLLQNNLILKGSGINY
jgi:hypothetical protein